MFWRRRQERELDEELRHHIEAQAEIYIREGLAPAEARRRAQIELGGVEHVKEGCREVRMGTRLELLWQDVKLGARALRKAPGFTAVALLTLALVIGANSAIFSLVNAILIQQLPFSEPDRLVWVASLRPDGRDAPFALPEYMDYREQSRSFEHLAAFASIGLNLTGMGDTERLQGVRVSADYFTALGVRASLGRVLRPDDDLPRNPRVAVLGHGLWQRRFGGDTAIVGRALVLNGVSHEVVGVLSPEFAFLDRTAEIAVPLVPDADSLRHARSSVNFLRVVGRLRPEASLRQAQEEMNAICSRLRERFPEAHARDAGVRIALLHQIVVGNFQRSLWVLLAAMGLVLVTASANLANLLLTRASARQREMALRHALGASRARLVRQLCAEGALLAAAGGGMGLALAGQSLQLLLRLAPADMPRLAEVRIDATVLGWTLAVSVLAGLLFSLAPAWQASRADAQDALKEAGGAFSAPKGQRRLRHVLVMAEVGMATVLLVAGGLLLKSFARLQQVDPGFRAEGVLAARLSLPAPAYPHRESVNAFYDKMRARLAALPGVESAGAISIAPMSGLLSSIPFTVEGRPPESPGQAPWATHRLISPGYLQTLAIPLLQGRDLTGQDTFTTRAVILVNQSLARRFFPRDDAVGGRLRIDDNNVGPRLVEIVGVVGDVKQSGLDQSPTYDVYLPLAQLHPDQVSGLRNNMFWMLRAARDPLSLAEPFRTVLREVAYDVPASSIQPLGRYVANWTAPREFNLKLLLVFAAAALVLAASGTYGVLSYSVALRTREIGIRMALGAQRKNILMQILAQGAALALAGLLAGLLGALWLGAWMRDLLFEVAPFDPATLGAMAILVLIIALLASYVPARRATRVDPLAALRCE